MNEHSRRQRFAKFSGPGPTCTTEACEPCGMSWIITEPEELTSAAVADYEMRLSTFGYSPYLLTTPVAMIWSRP